MTNPIPDDLIQEARLVSCGYGLSDSERMLLQTEVEEALQAERRKTAERCAAKARWWGKIDWEDGDGGEFGHGFECACEEIANALANPAFLEQSQEKDK